MPNLLYIDTSASKATVAFSQEGKTVAIRMHDNANEQAAVLNIMINNVLEEASNTLDNVDALCVCAGPGSYTGLRVGLSTAKGIAYVKDIPLMLFNRLDLIAWEQNKKEPFAIALKARNGEYFFATYTDKGAQSNPPQHLFEQDLAPYVSQDLLFITDDVDFSVSQHKETIDANHTLDMNSWIANAEERFRLKQFDDLAYSEPFYLKSAYTTQSKK
ncbi:MAG: tRNA (adenosine(37)-N6)-threonylcarbamoyltransferase complex dimerization subunit type 1 TsaB [Taibaiella sp.]|jgi:tRNA threonylcarbamoyladenosine biosynthesis protein TsaB